MTLNRYDAMHHAIKRLIRCLLLNNTLLGDKCITLSDNIAVSDNSIPINIINPLFNARGMLMDFDSLYIKNKEIANIDDVIALMSNIECYIDRPQAFDNLKNEIYRSYYLEHMAIHSIQKNSLKSGIIEFILNNPSKAFIAEHIGSIGHPHHPCAKNKTGMSDDECMRYLPEFFQSVKISILAVHKSYIQYYSINNINPSSIMRLYWPNEFTEFIEHIQSHGEDKEDFFPMFVHPLQLQHVIHQYFSDEIDKNKIYITDIYIDAVPTLSVRTLITGDISPNIKLPMDVQMTGSKRNLGVPGIKNAICFSEIISNILQKSSFSQCLNIATDFLGVYYNKRGYEKFFSYILRDNPYISSNNNAFIMYSGGLCIFDQYHKKHIIFLIIARFAGTERPRFIDIEKWMQHYLDYIKAFFYLYFYFGIALEAHQQNLLLQINKNGMIEKLIYRDYSGSNIHIPTLEKFFDISKIDMQGSAIEHNISRTRDRFCFSILQAQIGDLIDILSYHNLHDIDINPTSNAKMKIDDHATTISSRNDFNRAQQKQYTKNSYKLWKIVKMNMMAWLNEYEQDNPQKAQEEREQILHAKHFAFPDFLSLRMRDTNNFDVSCSITNPMNIID